MINQNPLPGLLPTTTIKPADPISTHALLSTPPNDTKRRLPDSCEDNMESDKLSNPGDGLNGSLGEPAPKRVKLTEQEPGIAPSATTSPGNPAENVGSTQSAETSNGAPITSSRCAGKTTSSPNGNGGTITSPCNPGTALPPQDPTTGPTTHAHDSAIISDIAHTALSVDCEQLSLGAQESHVTDRSQVAGNNGVIDGNHPSPAIAGTVAADSQEEAVDIVPETARPTRRSTRRTRKAPRYDDDDDDERGDSRQDEAMDGAFEKPGFSDCEPATHHIHPPSAKADSPITAIVTSEIAVNIRPASPAEFRKIDLDGGDDTVDGLPYSRHPLSGNLTNLQLLDWAYQPVTDEERREFRGFLDLESDPPKLNHVLAKLGLTEFKLSELYSWDDDSFACIPENTAGLIFLARYIEEDKSADRPPCPDNIWFANQTSENSCATIALINVAMNAETMRIGDILYKFRQQTLEYDSPVRGHVLANNNDIRAAHNSFASRLDMLKADKSWVTDIKKLAAKFKQMDVAEAKKEKAKLEEGRESPSKKRKALPSKKDSEQNGSQAPAASRKKKQKKPALDPNAPYHYVAYVPIGNEVWELDGLKRQPLLLGTFDPDSNDDFMRSPTQQWCDIARKQIGERFDLLTGPNGVFVPDDVEPVHMSLLAMEPSPAYNAREEFAGLLRGVWMLLDRFRDELHLWAPHRAEQITKTLFSEFRPPGWSSIPLDKRIIDAGGPKWRLAPASDFCDLTLGEVEYLDVDEDAFAKEWGLENMTWQEAEEQFHAMFEESMPELRKKYTTNTKDRMEDTVENFSPVIQKWVSTLAKEDKLREIVEELQKQQKLVEAEKKKAQAQSRRKR